MLGEDFGVKKVQTINRRMFIIGAAKFIVFTGIIARLFSLQITENKKYLTLSDKNRLREWRLPPVRGKFLDHFGNVIAGNLKVFQLHVIPEDVQMVLPAVVDHRLRAISDASGRSSESYSQRLLNEVDIFSE